MGRLDDRNAVVQGILVHLLRSGSVVRILSVAAALRLLWALLVPVELISDPSAYHALTSNLARGLGYAFEEGNPSAFWPPGTAFFYTPFYAVLGIDPRWTLIPNVLLGLYIVYLGIEIARRVFDERIAEVTGWLLAVWPLFIQFTTVMASELLFTVLLLGSLLAWARVQNPWGRGVAVGLLTGCAAYVRPQALPLPIIFGVCEVSRGLPIGRAIWSTGTSVVLSLALIAPWSIRNHQAFGHFVLISANGGAVLWMGNNPESQGNYMPLPERVSHLNDAERDSFLREEAMAHIKERPGLFIRRCLNRLRATWDRETIGVAWNPGLPTASLMPIRIISSLYWWIVGALGLVGFVLWIRRDGWRHVFTEPYVLSSLAFGALYAVSNGNDRYHMPTGPLIAMLAACTLVELKGRGWLASHR
ncbi:MAG: glycosyltransferase family 39 protein [Myxococcota bacterium]